MSSNGRYCYIITVGRQHIIALIGPSTFLAVFPYAFIAIFPIFGIIIVTKWELDNKKRKKKKQSLGDSRGN